MRNNAELYDYPEQCCRISSLDIVHCIVLFLILDANRITPGAAGLKKAMLLGDNPNTTASKVTKH